MEREWKLGVDMLESDNMLDAITFDELILTLHCNLRKEDIDAAHVRGQLAGIIESKFEDMKFLLENNMNEIIAAAKR